MARDAHTRAMDLAERALVKRLAGKEDEAFPLFEKALREGTNYKPCTKFPRCSNQLIPCFIDLLRPWLWIARDSRSC